MNKQGRDILYVVAGGYLLYLSYSLLGGVKTAGGTEKIISIIACVVFTLIGAYLVVTRLKRIMAPQEESAEETEIVDAEENGEETEETAGDEEVPAIEAADEDEPTL